MRQGQNSKRSRGRGRKPQNSANRSYESNGPDVKIRGTAAHVCEKYQQLARDALSSGDRVTAENYFQHAEHYYRLLMAAQAGQEPNRQTANLGYRPNDEEEEEFDSSNENAEKGNDSSEAASGNADGQAEDAGKEKKSSSANGEDEAQPRRRQNRRRRPRAEARDGGEGNGAEKADGGADAAPAKADSGSDTKVDADGAAA